MSVDTLCSYLGYIEDSINQTVSDYVGWITDISPAFFWSFIRQPSESGTFLPLSPFVARRLIKNIPQGTDNSPPRRILEAGPGSGAVTRHLVERLGRKDTLVLVEYDKLLSEKLKNIFKTEIEKGLVEVNNASLQDLSHWNPDRRKFDVIVSTIPLNSLPSVDVLRDIFQAFIELANLNCFADFGEYAGTSSLRNLISWLTGNKAYLEITAEKIQFFQIHSHAPSEIEIRNIPPARVIHCMLNRS